MNDADSRGSTRARRTGWKHHPETWRLVSAFACEYTLTPLEFTLIEALCGVWLWVAAHAREVEWARRKFNKRKR